MFFYMFFFLISFYPRIKNIIIIIYEMEKIILFS